MSPYSVYLHIPFCRHRCAYCDFNTYAGLDALVPEYVRALCGEIEFSAQSAPGILDVHTVFFGGGTPSLLPAPSLEAVISTLSRRFSLASGLEMTLEANPGTLTPEYLRAIRHMGVNRLSLGMQSANPQELLLLERQHDFRDVIQAVTWARQTGFENINLDLIFGLPYQSLDSWQKNLKLAVGLGPDHLSLYALTLEHGTPMQHWVGRGLLDEPDPDLAAEMYEWAEAYLEQSGFQHYEISNWARRDGGGQILACQHNLQYWRCLPYFGYGAGAHGNIDGFRIANILSPSAYIQRLTPQSPILNHKSAVPNPRSSISNPQSSTQNLGFPLTPVTLQVEAVDAPQAMSEVMIMGLRLTQEGVSRRVFYSRFGQELEEVYQPQIERLVSVGLLEWAGEDRDALRLTPRGRLLGNQVFVDFV
jgi:oxygen-independent coproporphyrinogen-3 oxidase